MPSGYDIAEWCAAIIGLICMFVLVAVFAMMLTFYVAARMRRAGYIRPRPEKPVDRKSRRVKFVSIDADELAHLREIAHASAWLVAHRRKLEAMQAAVGSAMNFDVELVAEHEIEAFEVLKVIIDAAIADHVIAGVVSLTR